MTEVVCPPDHAHGRNGTCYTSHKCRCDDCRRGRAEYMYYRHHMQEAGREPSKLVDATGTHRRLQALVALGWPLTEISQRTGRHATWAGHVLKARRVERETADLVSRVYDELSMTVPTPTTKLERKAVANARCAARRHGWVPPLAWDDDVIDDPAATPHVDVVDDEKPARWVDRFDESLIEAAVRGERPRLTPAERREAIRRLNARAWSARRIGAWLGCSERTVERARKRLHLPVPDQMTIRDAA